MSGAMFMSVAVSSSAVPSAVYIGGESPSGFTSASILSVYGAQIGDMLVVYRWIGSFSVGSGGSFTSTGGTPIYRILNSADIAAVLTCTDDHFMFAIWRGAATLALVSGPTTGNPVAFNKAANHAGILGFIDDQDNSSPIGGLLTSPPSFTQRQVVFFGGPAHISSFTDRLYPDNSLYADGTGFVRTTGGDFPVFTEILEFRT